MKYLKGNERLLKRLLQRFPTVEKPSHETLDKLALLAGFQDWEGLTEAVHGRADASLNFEEGID